MPNDAVQALAGYYILFALVDDIPSIGRMVRITPTQMARPSVPSISITALDANAAEPGADTGSMRVTRTGATTGPLTVTYVLSGSAVNGADYSTLSNYVVIPSGSSNANVNVTPRDDSAAEGIETVSLTLFDTAAYSVGVGANAVVNLADNEVSPPPLGLNIVNPSSGQFELTLTGPATRAYTLEATTDFDIWRPFAVLLTTTNSARLAELMTTNPPYLFFRARE